MKKNDAKSVETKNRATIEAYNKSAMDYSLIFSGYKSKLDHIMRAIQANISGEPSVLELGCGSGIDAKEIIKQVGSENYVGVDASSELVKLARNLSKDGTFHVKSFVGNDFWEKTGRFGVILAFYSMLHVNQEEARQVLENAYKTLEKGGVFYILSKHGDYKEIEIENFGSKKYYYSYKPEEIEGWVKGKFKTLYKVIEDTDYGPSFALLLRKI